MIFPPTSVRDVWQSDWKLLRIAAVFPCAMRDYLLAGNVI